MSRAVSVWRRCLHATKRMEHAGEGGTEVLAAASLLIAEHFLRALGRLERYHETGKMQAWCSSPNVEG